MIGKYILFFKTMVAFLFKFPFNPNVNIKCYPFGSEKKQKPHKTLLRCNEHKKHKQEELWNSCSLPKERKKEHTLHGRAVILILEETPYFQVPKLTKGVNFQ